MQLVTIMGQTSSGKTTLSIKLAKEFQSRGKIAVIFGADSRQIYKKLNIGSAKIKGKWVPYSRNIDTYLCQGVPHFLIDQIDVNQKYTLTDYLKDYIKTLNILKLEKKVPDVVILCGGTGLYTRAINEEYQPTIILEEFEKDWRDYKNSLTNMLDIDLISQFTETKDRELQKLYQSLNHSEQKNPRRLINHLANYQAKINNWLGDSLEYPEFVTKQKLVIAIDSDQLKQNLINSVQDRIQEGLIGEIQKLSKLYGNERLLELGLEYGLGAQMITENWSFEEYASRLIKETIQYQRRQLIWLKTEPNLKWIEL